MYQLQQHIEAMIFSSETAVSQKDIIDSLNKLLEPETIDKKEVEKAILAIQQKYEPDTYAFGLAEVGGGYQFLSKPDFHKTISTFLNQTAKRRLSSAALETLSIIAYKQPVTKVEVEEIRGVSCDYTIHKLLDKDLIEIAGKKEGPGRPILYEVSQTFLDYFGINSTEDLPKLKEIQPKDDNAIGLVSDIEEDSDEDNEDSVASQEEE